MESPMAMACSGDLAPWYPLRIRWISSRTNSPAWVEADLPAARSSRARLMGDGEGIPQLTRKNQKRQGGLTRRPQQ